MKVIPASRPALLVLTAQFPYPPHQGATIRSYNLLRQLAERSDVDLISFVRGESGPDALGPLPSLCRRIATALTPQRSLWLRLWTTLTGTQPDMALRYASADFAQHLEEYLAARKYDAVLFVGIDVGPYLEQVAEWRGSQALASSQPRLIFDDINAEYLLQRRAFETDARLFYQPRRLVGAVYSFIQWRRLARYEAHLCRVADDVVVVSEADGLALQRLVPGLTYTVVPNGVDLERYRPAEDRLPAILPQPALVFTGKMDFRPNVDAACWFAHEVYPLVRRAVPQATFAIVGSDPHPRVQQLASLPGVLVTGVVEDDLPYFHQAAVYVVPLRVGGGTRLKVLSAMATQTAIVSTSLGCEGLGVTHGQELLLADEAPAFADGVLKLLENPLLRQQLGRRARRFAETRFSWSQIAPRLERLYGR